MTRQGVALPAPGMDDTSLLSTTSREGDVSGQELAPTLPQVPTLQEDLDGWESRRGEHGGDGSDIGRKESGSRKRDRLRRFFFCVPA